MTAGVTESGWVRDDVDGTPVRLLPPAEDSVGIVFVLPDGQWPEPDDWQTLHDLVRAARLGAVVPDVRPWWIDRPDPALGRAESPLAFVAEKLVPSVSRRWPSPSRPAVLGVGFGGQGALQLAYRFPQLFPIVAAISPAIDFHRLHDSMPQLQEWFETSERARQETVTLRLHPLNWPPHQWFACSRGDWRFDGCERLASKLASIGLPFTADLETPGGPNFLAVQLRRAFQFVTARLNEPATTREIRFGR
ncbi:Putative esterase [Caulifigura coniformis]|uniref:Esterase n=1 Tax=Caulifigura coniformis TaxID=2527983 RepID=A0A517SMV2_9PLAN|nr:alpha/beta hydrolase-fold protein [Caulifigura coniformis]QDT57451.1 Putative esterase [Caulifigura coniformis]